MNVYHVRNFYFFRLGVTVRKELVKNDSVTPHIGLFRKPGLIDGLRGVPARPRQTTAQDQLKS